MAIHTHQSLSGFIASDPQLTFTTTGDARFYTKIGREHYRKEPDGSFTQIETTFRDLVTCRKTAEHAYARFAKGDKFLAEGYTREYEHSAPDGETVHAEEFVAKKLGHDLARTTYEVDRARRSRPAAEHETPAAAEPPRATAPTTSMPSL